MARSAFTLRLPTEERVALEDLSRVEGRPMNQLLNDAVRMYLKRRGETERSLAESLDRLQAYRECDPEFRSAIAAVAKAEVSFDDPLEGTLFMEQPDEAESMPEDDLSSGPLQRRVRDLLSA